MRKIALTIMLLVLTAVNGAAFAQRPSANIVRTTIADADVNLVPLSIQSDAYSDPSNPLGSYLNGTDSVTSQIQGIGDWELSLLSSLTRTVNVNFDDFVGGSTLNAPASGYYPVRFLTQCTGINYGGSLLNLTTVGQTARCGLIVAVKIGTENFSLRFYSANATATGSNDISVECTSVANGKCSGWRTQSATGAGKLIAKVLKVDTVKGKQVLTNYGLYRFSFDISFTKP